MKFLYKVHELCLGKAPDAVALIRYNQGVVPVLSYVAQIAIPPDSYNVQSLAHRALHSILRIPLNCFLGILQFPLVFVRVLALILLAAFVLRLGIDSLSVRLPI